MNLICKSATQVPGRGVVDKGQTIEWPNETPFPPHMLGNFVEAETELPIANAELPPEIKSRPPTPEEAAAEQARAEKIARSELLKRTAALGHEKLTAALDACGQTYRAKDTCETLAKLLLRAQGQDID